MSDSELSYQPRVIPAASSRSAARLFNYGNLIAMLLPVPFCVLWFGASIIVFAMNRHHPNPRVGYYTQQAAYRFYAVIGLIVVIGTAFAAEWRSWLITWAVSAAVLIPWSILDLIRIAKEQWHDVTTGEEHA